jgi:hypothetical protein
MRGGIARAIRELIERQTGYAAFNAAENSANASGALVEALKIAETDDTRNNLARAIGCLAQIDEGEGGTTLIAAGGCYALVEVFKIAETDDENQHCIGHRWPYQD